MCFLLGLLFTNTYFRGTYYPHCLGMNVCIRSTLKNGRGTFLRMLVITYQSARCHTSAEHSIIFQCSENLEKSLKNSYLVTETKRGIFGNGKTNRPVW
jgi:hypothetical protein